MDTPTPLLNTLNGGDGAAAQFDMLKAMIGSLVRMEMAQVQVMGAGRVIVHPGGQQSTLLHAHE